MAIPVICPGCKSTFTVSDKFTGRTGPCPKCKKPITIPAAPVKEVTIHAPDEAAASAPGRITTTPIEFVEQPVPKTAFIVAGVSALVLMLLALIAGRVWKPEQFPLWLLAVTAYLVAVPCAWLGYEIVRDRNFEPYRGRTLLVRSLICGAVYAALWAVKGLLPAEMTAEMWAWVYLGPPFFLVAALAALATFDLDWGAGVGHYSLYLMFTALLRWLAGFMPV